MVCVGFVGGSMTRMEYSSRFPPRHSGDDDKWE